MKKGLIWLIAGILLTIGAFTLTEVTSEKVGVILMGATCIATYLLSNLTNLVALESLAASIIITIGMIEENSIFGAILSALLAFAFFAVFFLRNVKEWKTKDFENYFRKNRN